MKKFKWSSVAHAGGLVLSLLGGALRAYHDNQERERIIKKEVEKVLKNQKPNI